MHIQISPIQTLTIKGAECFERMKINESTGQFRSKTVLSSISIDHGLLMCPKRAARPSQARIFALQNTSDELKLLKISPSWISGRRLIPCSFC